MLNAGFLMLDFECLMKVLEKEFKIPGKEERSFSLVRRANQTAIIKNQTSQKTT